MFKKLLLTLLSLTFAAVCCTGCRGGNKDVSQDRSSGKDAPTVPQKPLAPVSDSPIPLDALPTENMAARSRLYDGDPARLYSKLKITDRPLTIAFLGDSITQGSIASWENQYTNCLAAWWKENISDSAEFINAGIGATDSYLAVHRVDTDVLSHNPDIIFIEFINDADSEFYKTTMEGLVRKCLFHENSPAVVLIEMTQDNGTCPQNVHSEVAYHYGLPVISYHDAVLPEVEAGNISWQDISPDNIHPNDIGHRMLAELISRYISDVFTMEDPGEPHEADRSIQPLTSDKYQEADLITPNSDKITVTDSEGFDKPSSNDRFPGGLSCSDGGTFTFEAEFKSLGILFEKLTDGTGGTAFISVDGELVCEAEANFSGGWGDYASNQEIISFEERTKHTVTVKVIKGKRFDMLRWMVS